MIRPGTPTEPRRAIEIAREIGDRLGEVYVSSSLGEKEGELAQAVELRVVDGLRVPETRGRTGSGLRAAVIDWEIG